MKRIFTSVIALLILCTACGSTPDQTAEVSEENTESVTAVAQKPVNITTEKITTAEEVEPIITETEINLVEKVPIGNSGKELNIYIYDYSFSYYIEEYYLKDTPLPEGVEVNFHPFAGEVQGAFDSWINGNVSDDDYPDLFLLPAEVLGGYLYTDFAVPISELGITESDTADQFEFTKKLTSDDDGVQRGVMYELAPEVFIYRKSIARNVLGTDDPEKIAEYVKNFTVFEETAKLLQANGCYILGSHEEAFRAYTQPNDVPIFDEDGYFVLSDSWGDWAKETEKYVHAYYTNNAYQFNTSWYESIRSDNVLGFIGPSWYSDKIYNVSEDIGDWAACPGPAATYWKGSILFAANGTDNADIVADIMRTFTVDKETLKEIASSHHIVTNTVSGMTELAGETVKTQLFGDFNPFGAYTEVAENISKQNKNLRCPYAPYEYLTEIFNDEMQFFIVGLSTYKDCVVNYKNAAYEKVPVVAEADGRVIYLTYKTEDNLSETEIEEIKENIRLRLDAADCPVNYDMDYDDSILTVELLNPESAKSAAQIAEALANSPVFAIRMGGRFERKHGKVPEDMFDKIICDNADIESVEAVDYEDPYTPGNFEWGVALTFTEEGAEKFAEAVGFSLSEEMQRIRYEFEYSFWIDDNIIAETGYVIFISDRTLRIDQVTGYFYATELADKFNAALNPVNLELLEMTYDKYVY
jgi:hypothetical protein